MIGASYGGNQDWLIDPMMRLGGCAALAACDSCIYFDRYFGTKMSVCDAAGVTKEEYIRFSGVMKAYLRPRWSGVNKTQIYIDGFGAYLKDRGIGELSMASFSGQRPYAEAIQAVKNQIDGGYPVPYLMLRHRDAYLNREYGWHWFLLNGYSVRDGRMEVKAVTYAEWEWIDFEKLWETGFEEKGGMIVYRLDRMGNRPS